MEKIKFLFLSALVALCLVSCDDKDGDAVAQEIAGKYTGSIAINVKESPMPAATGTVELAKTGDNVVKLSLTTEDENLKSIIKEGVVIEGIAVSKAETKYGLKADVKNITLFGQSVPCEGKLEGTVENEVLALSFDVTVDIGLGSTIVSCSFTEGKLAK